MVRKTKSITKTDPMIIIEVEDLFDELTAENNRLVNELLFANNCLNLLNELKSYLQIIHAKYKTMIAEEDVKQWQRLQESVDTTVEEYNQSKTRQKAIENTVNRESNDDKLYKSSADIRSNCLSSTTTVKSITKKRSHTINKSKLNDNSRPYVCRHTDCGKRFKLKSHLSLHSSTVHNTNVRTHTCHVCHKSFKARKLLADHLMIHDVNRMKYQCPECGKLLSTMKYLRIHQRSVHSLDITDQTNDDHLPDAVKPDHELARMCQNNYDKKTQQYYCPDRGCRKPYAQLWRLYNHFKSTHPELQSTISVDDCNLQTTTMTTTIVEDTNNSSGDRKSDEILLLLLKQNNFDELQQRYLCPFPGCDRKYVENRGLQLHFEVSHYKPECKPFVCRQCGMGFKRNCMLKEHMKTHELNRQKTFQCPECDKSFYKGFDLKRHERTKHSNGAAFKCGIDDCQEMFATVHQRRLHRQSVHNKKYALNYKPDKHLCQWPGCDYRCGSTTQLNNHTRIHTGERPYVCQWPQCDKRFRLKIGYDRHQICHENLKPYACQWPGCDYRGNTAINCHVHQKIHQRQQQQVIS